MKKLLSTYLFLFFISVTISITWNNNEALAAVWKCQGNNNNVRSTLDCSAAITGDGSPEKPFECGTAECELPSSPAEGETNCLAPKCSSFEFDYCTNSENSVGCVWAKVDQETGISDDTQFQSDNSFSRTLCNVLGLVTGAGGKAFTSFAIMSLGIGFFTGKVSWGLMIGVAAGIAAMFGAPTIVAAIAGQDKALDCTYVTADGS